ncbi:MAG TPA: DMT family transporter [Actinomycetota bacterium]
MSRRHLVLLLVGIAAISSSAVLVRVAADEDAPAFAIAFYRCAMAAAILVPLGLLRHRDEYRSLSPARWRLALLSGVFLGAHFSTWIPSITFTTVAASAVLVQTTPIWVALMGRVIGERPTRRGMVGILIALGGTVVIAGGGFQGGTRALFGDLLALAGAVLGAAYVLCGRSLRREISVVTYTGIVYTTAAALLAVIMLVSGTPFFGYSSEVWALFAAMTLGPQLGGHTVFNYLLGSLSATIVSIALLAEPVGATILAVLVLGERPGAATLVGGCIVLAGVFIAIRAEAERTPEMLETVE